MNVGPTPWGLAPLLAPVPVEQFLSDSWERAPLYVGGRAPAYYPRWFALADLEAWLWSQRRSDAEDLLLAEAGRVYRRRAPSRTTLEQVVEAFGRGETLQINGLHRTWEPLARLAARVGRDLDARVHVNAYLTPASHQGLPRHADGHDVLILAVEGRKRWMLFDGPVPLPTPDAMLQDHEYPFDFRDLGSRAAGPPRLDLVLEPGSLLYIPRGVVHEATAVDGPSLHLSLGLYPLHELDLLHYAVAMAAQADVEMRRALRGAPDPARLAGFLKKIAGDPAALEAALRLARTRQVDWREALPAGQFDALLRLDVDASTSLHRRENLEFVVEAAGGEVVLRSGDRHLRGPAALRPTLEYVAATLSFTVSELPGPLDDAARIALARRLLREGLFVR